MCLRALDFDLLQVEVSLRLETSRSRQFLLIYIIVLHKVRFLLYFNSGFWILIFFYVKTLQDLGTSK